MTSTAAPKKHAKYSPSSIYRVLACAGSVKLSEDAPPQRTNPAAEEGTLAHELAELKLLKKKFEASKYPTFMHSDVNNFVKDLDKYRVPESDLLVETKVDLTHVHPELYGTADVSIVNVYDFLHVIDFKYGRGFVSEKRNPQLMTYLLGIAHLYNFDFADYQTSVYQPRYKGTAMRTYHTSKRELKEFEDELKRGIDLAESKSPPLVKGNHCHFCPSKLICPEISRKALAEAKHDFDNEVQPEPLTLSKDNIKALLDKAWYLKLWVAEVEAFASEELSKGKKIDGYSLVPTRPSTKWRDEAKLLKFIEKQKLAKYLYSTELVSPATARKNLSKKYSDTDIKKFFSTQTISVSSGYKLSNETDTSHDFDDNVEA